MTYTFDANGRTTTMGDATGITTYDYDQAGQQTQVGYPIGVFLTYAYDPVGNRSTMLDQDPSTGSGQARLTNFSYDHRKKLTSVLNPFAETPTWACAALVRDGSC